MGRTSYESVIVSTIGEFGLSQFFIVLTVKSSVLITAYAMVMTSLISAEPDWWFVTNHHNTTSNQNENDRHLKTCPNELNETGKIVFNNDMHTIVAEWSLVCELEWVPRTITTIQMIGAILSPPVMAQSADWFGRKTCLLTAYSIILVSVLCHGLSSSWQMMMGVAFFLGFGIGGVMVVANIYYLEFVGTKWRTLCGTLPAWAVGVMFLGGVWFIKPNWRSLCLVNFVSGCPILILLCFSPESIRWLLVRGYIDKGKRTLARLARFNSREEPDMAAIDVALEEDREGEGQQKNYTFYSLLKYKYTRWRTIVFGFIWFVMSLGYYAITFGVGTFEGNMGINMFFQGVAEVLAAYLVVLLSRLAGRRWSSFSLITITAATMLGITIAYLLADTKTYVTLKRVLALVAKLFLTAAWINVTLFTIETFPTVIRNIAYGFASLFSRIAGALAPQHINLHNIATHLPFTFNGVLQIISALLCLCLTDTYTAQLEDHFQCNEEEDLLPVDELADNKTESAGHLSPLVKEYRDHK